MARFIMLIFVAAVFCTAMAGKNPVFKSGSEADGYLTFCVGNCNRPLATTATFGLILMGGGTDVDDAFRWLNQNTNGGDVVVLRTTLSDGYNDYIYDFGGVNSVTTICITNRNGANADEVATLVRGAEGIFMAGGDQSEYLDRWKDTSLSEAMLYAITNNNATIGGTSAGLAVMGEYIYTGETGSIVSDEALQNPYHRFLTLSGELIPIPFMGSIITDSHFRERDRMGRLLTFMARLEADEWTRRAYGVAVSEQTALLVDQTGFVNVVGRNEAYFLDSPGTLNGRCEENVPLTYVDIRIYKVTPDQGTFDLSTWSGRNGQQYYIDCIAGVLKSTQDNPLRIY